VQIITYFWLKKKIKAMAANKTQRITLKGYSAPIISDTVKSHADDPYVLDKVAKAKEFLRKHPIPQHILKK
jgi:hypothetical protein